MTRLWSEELAWPSGRDGSARHASAGPVGEPVQRVEHFPCLRRPVAGEAGEVRQDAGLDERSDGAPGVAGAIPSSRATVAVSTTGCRSNRSARRQVAAPRRARTVDDVVRQPRPDVGDRGHDRRLVRRLVTGSESPWHQVGWDAGCPISCLLPERGPARPCWSGNRRHSRLIPSDADQLRMCRGLSVGRQDPPKPVPRPTDRRPPGARPPGPATSNAARTARPAPARRSWA